MKKLIIFLLLFTVSCAKPKSVLICGDHECINKKEAKQYFEENLSLEVRIISKKKEITYDLIDLNMDEKKQNIKIKTANKNKIVKKLSKEQIKLKKKEIKEKSKSIKKTRKEKPKKKLNNTAKLSTIRTEEIDDICLKLEKCDIDNITDYLININKKKDYPNITARE